MNNRDYKIFAPNSYYHIFNRGNAKQDIFLDDEDRKFFLFRLKEYLNPPPKGKEESLRGAALVAERHTPYIRKALPPEAFCLLCYCLMPNHFHFLIKQNGILPVSKLISQVCTSYSKYFNKKYDRVGSVYQSPFRAVRIENDSQLLWTSAYIHNNPKTAGLTQKLEDYPWSSYPDYISLRQGTLCEKDFILKMFKNDTNAYKKFVEDAFEKIKERKDLKNLLLD
jgi:REP element-mobilizing transposase RayT